MSTHKAWTSLFVSLGIILNHWGLDVALDLTEPAVSLVIDAVLVLLAYFGPFFAPYVQRVK